MITKAHLGMIAALAAAFAVFGGTQVAHADSNTLDKIGKAIQYPVRKDTENLSVDAHRGENRKSVESMRPQKAEAVVIPNGKTFVIHHRGNMPMYAHHRMHRHYSHRLHRYYWK
jgi:hypothetical protein